MKKVLALVIVVVMLASMTPLALAAPEYVGEVTVALPGFGGLEFTLSSAGSKYAPATDFGYGLSTMVYGEPGSTISFNQDVTFGLMGADAGAAAAGEAVVIDTIDGCYVYAPDMSQYVIFLTPNNPSGQFTEDSMVTAITDVAAGAAPAEAPAEAPAAGGDAAALPVELASAFPVGVWPMAAGSYDPALDEVAVPAGATLYGLFDAAYAVIDPPATVTGFEQVDDIAALVDGTWFLILGSSGFNYVAVMSEGGFAAAAPTAPEAPAEEAPAPVEEAPAPAAPAAAGEVYVTIVANGAVHVAAQPIKPSSMTYDSAIKAAHDLFYDGGSAAGFDSGIDASFNMFFITKVWGVPSYPYQVLNGYTTLADVAIKPGDNLIISASGAPFAVSVVAMTAETGGINVEAKQWVMDASYNYTSSPYANQTVTDINGNELGATDDKGIFNISEDDIPEDGVVIVGVDGAINLLTSITAPVVLDTNAKTAFVSVSIGGQFAISGINKIAALPVNVTINDGIDERTLEGVIKKAHSTYFSTVPGELQGYDSTQFWGIPGAVPRILFNDREVSLADAANITVNANDNIVFSLSRDTRVTPELVYVDYFINGSIAIGTVYTINPDGTRTIRVGAPLVAGDGEGTNPSTALTDPNGSVLATEGVVADAKGYFEVTLLPGDRDGILAVAGLYASNTNKSGYYPLFKGPDGRSLVVCLAVGLGAAIPLFIIVILAQRSEIKNRGLKMGKYKLNSTRTTV